MSVQPVPWWEGFWMKCRRNNERNTFEDWQGIYAVSESGQLQVRPRPEQLFKLQAAACNLSSCSGLRLTCTWHVCHIMVMLWDLWFSNIYGVINNHRLSLLDDFSEPLVFAAFNMITIRVANWNTRAVWFAINDSVLIFLSLLPDRLKFI